MTSILRYYQTKYVMLKEGRKNTYFELTTPDRLLDANELENDGNTGNNVKVFSFASIAAATNNFAPESKLGEGGFGPVYKVCFQRTKNYKMFISLLFKC